MCENFMGKNILDPETKALCLEVGEHIRNKLIQYQEETGRLYNYEATPAESTCYRFVLIDKKIYPDACWLKQLLTNALRIIKKLQCS